MIGGSSSGTPWLSLLLHPLTFPWEFPQCCFCNGVVKVHDPIKDLSKTFMSLAEWLPGEVGFFHWNSTASCLWIPELLFSSCLSPLPSLGGSNMGTGAPGP